MQCVLYLISAFFSTNNLQVLSRPTKDCFFKKYNKSFFYTNLVVQQYAKQFVWLNWPLLNRHFFPTNKKCNRRDLRKRKKDYFKKNQKAIFFFCFYPNEQLQLKPTQKKHRKENEKDTKKTKTKRKNIKNNTVQLTVFPSLSLASILVQLDPRRDYFYFLKKQKKKKNFSKISKNK